MRKLWMNRVGEIFKKTEMKNLKNKKQRMEVIYECDGSKDGLQVTEDTKGIMSSVGIN